MEHHSNIVPWHFHRERKGAVLKWVDVADDGSFSLEAFERALTPAHQDRRDHADVERARHGDADQGDRRASPTRTACRCWSTARRARCISTSTCAISTSISTSSPATSSTARPASACSTARPSAARDAAAVQRRRRDDRGSDARHASPTTRRRIASRPARRRSSRRSGSARRSTISRASAARASARTRQRCAPTPTSGSARSIRCASSARRRAKGRSSSFTMEGAHAHDVATVIDRAGVAVRAGTHCAMPLLAAFRRRPRPAARRSRSTTRAPKSTRSPMR